MGRLSGGHTLGMQRDPKCLMTSCFGSQAREQSMVGAGTELCQWIWADVGSPEPAAHHAGDQLPGLTRQWGLGLRETAWSPDPGTVQTQSWVRNGKGAFAQTQLGPEGEVSETGEALRSVHTGISTCKQAPALLRDTSAHVHPSPRVSRSSCCLDSPDPVQHTRPAWAHMHCAAPTVQVGNRGKGHTGSQGCWRGGAWAAPCQGGGHTLPNAESPLGDPAACALGLEPTHQRAGVLSQGCQWLECRQMPSGRDREPLGSQGSCWKRSDLAGSPWGGACGIPHWLGLRLTVGSTAVRRSLGAV